MRTMLKLILLCLLLAAFVNAQGSARNANPPLALDECGKHYICLAPEMCVDNTKSGDISTGFVTDTMGKSIYDDCPALLKIHSYGAHWAIVHIESFIDNAKSIEFIVQETKEATSNEIAKFSCQLRKNEENVWDATYGPQQRKKVPEPEKPKKTIKCSFEVKLKSNEQIFNGGFIHAKAKIGDDEKITKTYSAAAIYEEKCDPSTLKFLVGDEDITKRMFKKVQYSPEKYYCEDDFEMEYRPEGAEKYEKVVKLECPGSGFQVTKMDKNNQEEKVPALKHGDMLEIRCVTEARFYCNYEVKAHATERKVDPFNGDPKQNISSKLKCPPDTRHLFVNGKPMLGKEFECLNYGGETMWTIDNIPLSKTEPIAYCSKTLPCNLLHKIRESAVTSGKIDTDYLPSCHKEGTLKVGDETVTEKKCDLDTGNFVYSTAKAANQIITDQTKFVCHYPADKKQAEQQNEENAQTFTVGAVVASLLAAGLLAVSIGGLVVYANIKFNKERKVAIAQNEADFLRYANATQKRRAAFKPKKQVASNSAPPSDDPDNWNKLLQSIQITGLNSSSADDANNGKDPQTSENYDDVSESPLANDRKWSLCTPSNGAVNGKFSALAYHKELITFEKGGDSIITTAKGKQNIRKQKSTMP